MKKECILIAIIMTIALIFTPLVIKAENLKVIGLPQENTNESGTVLGKNNDINESSSDRYITIKLHAGEHGYFGDSTDPKETYDSVQFRGDSFEERTEPTPYGNYKFLGWSTDPNSDMPDVSIGGTNVSMLGTNLYAVYTNKCIVFYDAMSGYIETESGQYRKIQMEYDCGADFQYITPVTNILEVSFDKWYITDTSNNSEPLPANFKVNDTIVNVKAAYTYNDQYIEDMNLDQDYDLTIIYAGKFFKFTPTETDVYEIFTSNVTSPEGAVSPIDPDDLGEVLLNIDLLDQNTKKLKTSEQLPDLSNSHIIETLQAGTTYYFQIREMGLHATDSVGIHTMIRKSEHKTATYHSNLGDLAWFGDDHNTKEVSVPFTSGTRVDNYPYTTLGLNLADNEHYVFLGWTDDLDSEYDPEHKVFIDDEDVDLYAVYIRKNSITLHANGGYFPMNNGEETFKYVYIVGWSLDIPFEPHNDDNTKKLAGWSRNKNATVPDSDLLEMVTNPEDIFEDGEDRILYAVYDEKVIERFDANGGYFLDDPNITTYETTKGKGHIFYGLSLFHENPRMIPLGWVDQNDEKIPYTPGAYPYYTIEEDTEYTAVWGYEVILDANEGNFPEWNATRLMAVLEYDGKFSLANIKAQLGDAVPDDPNKYFVGWATTPDATTPDVIEGVTNVKDLDTIYAVYADDTYVITKGDKGTWTVGSEDGFEYIVKRTGDDRDTYSAFTYLKIDGELAPDGSYKRREGSLILTLQPDYLKALAVGEHSVEFTFGGTKKITTSFTITEETGNGDEETPKEDKTIPDEKEETVSPTEKEEKTPITGDNIMLYIYLLGISTISLIVTTILYKKRLYN